MANRRNLFLLIIFTFAMSSVGFAAVPGSLTHSVDGWTLQLTKQSFRGSNFEVLVQNAQGGYDSYDPGEIRTFIGTVDEDAGASAAAYYKQDGTLLVSIIFDRGGHYIYDGSTEIVNSGWMVENLSFPTRPTVTADHAGTTMYEYGMGYDIDYATYSAVYGESIQDTVNLVEFCHLHMAQIQMRNFLMKPVVQRFIIRASATHDPYISGEAILILLRDEWEANQADALSDCFKVAGVSVNKGGGVAYIGGRYSVNGIKATGLFYGVMRHEVGHNWGILDYDGGSPEGVTVMCGNGFARHCGTGVEDALNHRDGRLSSLDSIGTYTAVDIPPYASLDVPSAKVFPGDSVTIDVLVNDFDANGHSISIHSYDNESRLGGSVQLSAGTGPNGRDELIYTVPAGGVGVADSFYYEISDSTGQTSRGVVISTSEAVPVWSSVTDADTYVKDNLSHGDEEAILIKRSSAGADSTYTRTGWIHFDLADVQMTSHPCLKLTADSGTTSGTLSVWGIKDGRTGDHLGVDWTEVGLTKANAPLLPDFTEDADTTLIGSAPLAFAGEEMVFDSDALKDFLMADTNGEVTFLLVRNVNNSDFQLRSRENPGGGAPVLEMMPAPGVADAYVRGSTNRGFESVLEIKNDSNGAYIRETYLRFNYENQGVGPVQNAILTLTPTAIQTGRILRIRLTDDDEDTWQEGKIVTANKPVSSGLEITFSSSEMVLNQPFSIDVTTLVDQAMNNNSIATFHIDALTQSSTGINAFASREHDNENWHPVLDVTIEDSTPPASPTGLTALSDDGIVSLDWADNHNLDIASYRIYRSQMSGGPYNLIDSTSGTTSEYADDTVVNGTIYYYVVTAVDASENESGYSDQVEAGPRLTGDITGDNVVNLEDFAVLSLYWLQNCVDDPVCDKTNLDNLNGVDFDDFSILADHWLN